MVLQHLRSIALGEVRAEYGVHFCTEPGLVVK